MAASEDVEISSSGMAEDVDVDSEYMWDEEDPSTRNDAAMWLRKRVGVVAARDLPAEPSEEDFKQGLRSGMMLCNVLNKIKSGAVPKVVNAPSPVFNTPDAAALSAYFENIRSFLIAIEEIGLPTFEPSDLEQGGDFSRVVCTILALKAYSETGQTKFSWKSSSSGKKFARRNSEPAMSRTQSVSSEMSFDTSDQFGDPSDLIDEGDSSPIYTIVCDLLEDKDEEDIPIIVENIVNKIKDEIETRVADNTTADGTKLSITESASPRSQAEAKKYKENREKEQERIKQEKEQERINRQKEQERINKEKEQERIKREKELSELARKQEEEKAKEQERINREKELLAQQEKARKEAEERARKEAEERARKEEEERLRREEEERLRREEEERARLEQERIEREKELLAQQEKARKEEEERLAKEQARLLREKEKREKRERIREEKAKEKARKKEEARAAKEKARIEREKELQEKREKARQEKERIRKEKEIQAQKERERKEQERIQRQKELKELQDKAKQEQLSALELERMNREKELLEEEERLRNEEEELERLEREREQERASKKEEFRRRMDEYKKVNVDTTKRHELVGQQDGELQGLRSTLSNAKTDVRSMQTNCQEEADNLGKHVQTLCQAAAGYKKVLEENRKLYNQVQDLKGSIRVYCRIRPFLPEEGNRVTSVDYTDEETVTIIIPTKSGKEGRKASMFNKVFGPSATQEEVLSDTQPLIRSVLDGFNVCIFACGQTGAGKTYTLSGPDDLTPDTMGVGLRALNDLFAISEERKDLMTYQISINMLEIYNDEIRDLLVEDGTTKILDLVTGSKKGINVPDANLVPVSSTDDVINQMNICKKNRAANDHSNRSHSFLSVHVFGKDLTSGVTTRGCMHLVDLAGNEKVDDSDDEAAHIQKSLSALGDVLVALANKSKQVPYKTCKLTQFLQDALGAQAKILMFVHVHPDIDEAGETLSTFKFVERFSTVEGGAGKSPEVRELKEQVCYLKAALAKKESGDPQWQEMASSSPRGGKESGFGDSSNKQNGAQEDETDDSKLKGSNPKPPVKSPSMKKLSAATAAKPAAKPQTAADKKKKLGK